MQRLLVVSCAALASCYATVHSSSAHLARQDSTAIVAKPLEAVLHEIVLAFARRDISLVERTAEPGAGGALLRFSGGRRHAGGEGGYGERHTIDSIYYARLRPASGGTAIEMIGRPAVDGVEACTDDPGFELACSKVSPPEALADSVDGYQEAQVIRNLLTELALTRAAM